MPTSFPQNTWPGWTTTDGRRTGIGFLPTRGRAPSWPRIQTAAWSGSSPGGPESSGDAAYPGELYAIYIDESRQRQGLGRRLVAALGEWFISRGWETMLLWVLAENPSRRFYEALGGAEVRQQTITIGGTELVEIAYGWRNITPLTTGS